jgi:hypothetical protein
MDPGIESRCISIGILFDVRCSVYQLSDRWVPAFVQVLQSFDVAFGVPNCIFVGGIGIFRIAMPAANDGEEVFAEL